MTKLYEIWTSTQYCPVRGVHIPIHKKIGWASDLTQVVQFIESCHVDFNEWDFKDRGYYIREVWV